MKTAKKFRAWKGKECIPNAIPYDDTHIVIGTTKKQGQDFIKIEEVDCVEQLLNGLGTNIYEGDIVAFFNQYYHELSIGIAGLDFVDCDIQSFAAYCCTDVEEFEPEWQGFEEYCGDWDDLYDGIVIGNIHLDDFSNKELLLKRVKEKWEKFYASYR